MSFAGHLSEWNKQETEHDNTEIEIEIQLIVYCLGDFKDSRWYL